MKFLRKLLLPFQYFRSSNLVSVAFLLAFSMVALHYSLLLIQTQRYMLSFYNDESADLLRLGDAFEGFHEAGEHFSIDSAAPEMQNLRRELSFFSEQFLKKLEVVESASNPLYTAELKHDFSTIKTIIVDIAGTIQKIEKSQSPEQLHTAHAVFRRQFVRLDAQVHGLWASLFNREKYLDVARNSEIESQMVYWSIVALGLFGFILVVLNADKMGRLVLANQDNETSLQTLQQRLAAMEASSDGIGIIDANGVLTYMNSALMSIYGIPKEDYERYIGRDWMNIVHESGHEKLRDLVMPAVKKIGKWQGEEQIIRPDGSLLAAELSLTLLHDGGVVGTARDISKRLKDEQEKQVLQDQFFQAQKLEAVGRLAGGIAHDFNNILAAIKGYAEFLVDDLSPLGPEQEFAKKILEAGRQASSLVQQILTFSRRKQSEDVEFDIIVPFKECVTMLSSTLPKTIEMQVYNYWEETPFLMKGNQTQIAQLIMNLGVNAGDAMDGKHGRLTLQLSDVKPHEDWPREIFYSTDEKQVDKPELLVPVIVSQAENHAKLILGKIKPGAAYVRLSVEDTGTGMKRAIMERMFEPFFTTKPVNKGTGLGLSSVHGVVQAHGGAMIVESVVGMGTKFDLFFPLIESSAQKAAVMECIVPKNESEKARILLVEDADDVRHMTATLLKRMGHEVVEAVDGENGFEILRGQGAGFFDLVVTDQNMPKMTGIELIKAAQGEYADLPFIVVTGFSTDGLEDDFNALKSVRAVLKKPIDRNALAASINDILDKKTS